MHLACCLGCATDVDHGYELTATEPFMPAHVCVGVCVCAGVGVVVHFLAHLHSTCGPLVSEASEGSSQVLARTAAQLAMQVRELSRTMHRHQGAVVCWASYLLSCFVRCSSQTRTATTLRSLYYSSS